MSFIKAMATLLKAAEDYTAALDSHDRGRIEKAHRSLLESAVLFADMIKDSPWNDVSK